MTVSASELVNSKDQFLALLTKRMSEKGDFPAFAKSVQQLDELMHDQNKNIADIARVILNDFTLTQKVIRLANSAMYSGMGGEITTITQAAVVLGIDTIAHITLSIRFIDTLSASAPASLAPVPCALRPMPVRKPKANWRKRCWLEVLFATW